MTSLFILLGCVIAISILVIVTLRMRIMDKYRNLLSKLNKSSYSDTFIDIRTDLYNGFKGIVITTTQKKDIITHYRPLFIETNSLLKKCRSFNIKPSEILVILKILIMLSNSITRMLFLFCSIQIKISSILV